MSDKRSGSVFSSLWIGYLSIGFIFGLISFISNIVYYSWGPGAIWNIGFIAGSVGFAIGALFSILRVILWPFGIYLVVTGQAGFFEWLFYQWYAAH